MSGRRRSNAARSSLPPQASRRGQPPWDAARLHLEPLALHRADRGDCLLVHVAGRAESSTAGILVDDWDPGPPRLGSRFLLREMVLRLPQPWLHPADRGASLGGAGSDRRVRLLPDGLLGGAAALRLV